MAEYRVLVLERNNTLRAELEQASVQSVAWELNGPGLASFTVPTTDPKVGWLATWAREVAILRDDLVIFRGPITRLRATPQEIDVQVQGPLAYLSYRYVGKADRLNHLNNPSFEGNLNGWTAVGVTATAVTSHRFLGAWGARLEQAVAGVDTFLRQQRDVTGGGIGTLWTLAAWCHIHGDYPYTGPAFDERGLFIERRGRGYTNFLEAQWDRIGSSHRPGESYRQEVQIWTPPNALETLDIRLYAPGGRITWDAVTLTVMESLSFTNADVAEIARSLVVHAQDPAFSKSDLGIATDTPASGRTLTQAYQHADHRNIVDALLDLTKLGIDIDVEVSLTTKTFRTYAPQKGSFKGTLALETDRNLLDFSYSEDGQQTVNSIVVLGDGDGPDREEGFAVDATGLGGLVLEDVINAPTGTTIDALDGIAASTVNSRKVVPKVVEAVVGGSDAAAVITGLRVGDTVPLRVTHGPLVNLNGTWRAVRIDLDARREQMRVTLNP